MNILMVSLGCDKNLCDSEAMLGLLRDNKYNITNEESEADVVIVNTCSFIHDAMEESVNTVLEMAELKKERLKYLIVTGCLAQRFKDEIFDEIPEVDACIGTTSFDKIIQVPFALPVQAYDIETYITPLLKGEKEFLDLYVNLLTKFEVRNPRTIKRSFNLLQLYKCIELATSPGGNMILTTEMSLKRYAVLLLQLEFPDIHEQMTHSAVNCDAQEMYQEFVECLQDDSDNSDILVNGLTAVLQLFYGQDFDPDAENADAAKTEELAKILIETQEMLVPPEERQEIQRLPYAEFLKSLCEHLKDKVSIENTDVWNAVAAADSEQLALDKRSVELRGWGENNIPFTLTWNDRKPSPNLTVYAPLDAAQMFKGMENCFYNILEEKNKKKRGNLGYYHHGGERPRITLVLNLGKHTLAYTLQFLKNCGIIAE